MFFGFFWFFFCFFGDCCVPALRIMSLPHKRDGFWMATIRRLFPQNKASNWVGSWKPDGPVMEVFSAVMCSLFFSIAAKCVVLFSSNRTHLFANCRIFLTIFCSIQKTSSSLALTCKKCKQSSRGYVDATFFGVFLMCFLQYHQLFFLRWCMLELNARNASKAKL